VILGIDTSMAHASVCLLRAGSEAVRHPPPSPERLREPPAHSRELLPMVEVLLSRAGGDWKAIESVAVGIGPGTFTGLRIGIATARALAQALGVEVRPVSSLAALAAGVADRHPAGAAGRPIVPLIDARRRQVFAAVHVRARPDPPTPDAAREELTLELVQEPLVLDRDGALELVSQLEDCPVCAGDWALESRADLERVGAEVPPPGSGLHAVDALYVCRLGREVEPVAPAAVLPAYLRLPDAEIKRLETVHEGSQTG
jgi:tRNA threonylcarbamoyladenosine biosynthesis protein TsaB